MPDSTIHFLGLRGRIFLILTALVSITLVGGLVMIWYTYRMQSLFENIISTDVAALQTAQELETALVNQKGFVSYYFMDNNPEWLKQLEIYRRAFREEFQKARGMAHDDDSITTLNKIESEYNSYIVRKDRVIELYKAGDRDAGSALHDTVRDQFFSILNLCEQFKEIYKKRINSELAQSEEHSKRLRLTALTAMFTAASLGAVLAFVLISQILGPIRRLAQETTPGHARASYAGNEVATLKSRVRGLIEDVDTTHDELERSKERLFQSEKMALVGKLAAEVAHSIRNPMTSIKMRLFSLERTLDLSATQKEDFEVVSQEMRHLDNVVRNFLEFSRPPKLKMQRAHISDIVDMTLQLLQNQLDLNNVTVELNRSQNLPGIQADPELLKEVLVNLIVNACDAMGSGGRLVITEEEIVLDSGGKAIRISIKDNGPGIPGVIKDKVWEPFFSTKEDGTGLGLSIAMRIIEEHGGRIAVSSEDGQGATFTITLKVAELGALGN